MTRKKKTQRDKEVEAALDELLKGQRPEDILNEGGLVQDLTTSRRSEPSDP